MSSTKPTKLSEAAGSKGGEEEEEDLAVLIYRESQLRKREAAAAAAVKKRKRNTSASTHRATSTRLAVVAAIGDVSSAMASLETNVTKRKKRCHSADDEGKERTKKVTRKKYRKRCSADGCTNLAKKGGICMKHGAKVKRCSSEECTNLAVKGGVCIKHGATWTKKKCNIQGCNTYAKRRGVCKRHGAYRNPYDESTAFGNNDATSTSNYVQRGGVC